MMLDAAPLALLPSHETPADLPLLAAPLPADRDPAAVYLASLGSDASRRTMRQALTAIASLLGFADVRAVPWVALRYQHAAAIRARMVDTGAAPASVNTYLCALRGVAREARKLGLMSADACEAVCQVKGVKGTRLPAGRGLDAPELRALFGACDGATAQGARDAALLALLYGCGLRRSEVVALDVEHVDASGGSIRVLGKGNKERSAHLPPASVDALRAWIGLRGVEPGPLFVRVGKDGAPVAGARLTAQAVAFVLGRTAGRGAVAKFSPHDLRRSFVSDLLDAGVDLSTVQAMAGHASVTTTQRYDRRGERAKRAAAARLAVPFGAGRSAGS